MRYLTFLLIIVFQSTVIAKTAPDFSFENKQLSDLKGQVVYIDFWASWCGPCQKSFPWLNAMQEKYGDQGLVIVAINLDNEQRLAQKFLAKIPANFTITYDPEGNIASEYDIPGMPTSFLIGRDGEIKASHQGFHSDRKATYEKQIQALLSE